MKALASKTTSQYRAAYQLQGITPERAKKTPILPPDSTLLVRLTRYRIDKMHAPAASPIGAAHCLAAAVPTSLLPSYWAQPAAAETAAAAAAPAQHTQISAW